MRIKGSLFVDLQKSYQTPSAEKRSWQRPQKDFVQTQGQAQDRTRVTQGHSKDIKDLQGHMKHKPSTDLGQAKDKKDLRRAATEGKCNFAKLSIQLNYLHSQLN